MQNPSELYVHQLQRNRQEVRLLTLGPGTAQSTVSCTLSTVSLLDRPDYEALSYVWGNARDRAIIRVNDAEVSVTKNLEIALRHLRRQHGHRVVWVDALCINQTDIDERNQQVALMGSVYSSASEVVVWLGEADEWSDAAFDALPAIAEGHVDARSRSDAFGFFAAINQRAWFGRVWVMQEFVLARNDPIVVCSSKVAPWSTFCTAWKNLAQDFFEEIGYVRQPVGPQHGSETGTGSKSGRPEVLGKLKIDLFDDLREAVRREGGESLRQLLIYSRTSESSEPRDRIYGLLQMLKAEDRDRLVVDYRKPIAVVYAEAMAVIFEHGQGPRFISGMWCPSVDSRVENLPSWVPDFTSQVFDKTNSPSNISFHPVAHNSASGAGAGAANGVVLDDYRTLKIETLEVDVVEQIVHFERDLDSCIAQLPIIEALAIAATTKSMQCDERLQPFYKKFRSYQPLWRTLISDKISGYESAPNHYEHAYSHLLSHVVEEQLGGESYDDTIRDYLQHLTNHLPRRTFFVTQNGLVGVGMPEVHMGDTITIWFGAPVPFVIRYDGNNASHCSFIGAAYVAGIMNGEMVDELYCENLMDSKTLLVR